MNDAYLQVIKREIEKVEQDTGHGTVTILIKNGEGYQVKREHSTLILGCVNPPLDKTCGK